MVSGGGGPPLRSIEPAASVGSADPKNVTVNVSVPSPAILVGLLALIPTKVPSEKSPIPAVFTASSNFI